MIANGSSLASVFDESLPAKVTATCRHCADPCGVDAIVTDHGTFCCTGCETVFSLIASHGLTAFYACDVRPGVSQRRAALDRGRFAALDDPDVVRRLAADGGQGLATVTFAVPAIHCASCLWLLEQLWRFDAGIARAEADLMRRTVRVDYRPDRITLRAVAEQLAALGYEPVIDSRMAPRPACRRRAGRST